MIMEDFIKILTNEISSQSIMKILTQISHFHRIQGSKGYYNAAKYIESILMQNNLEPIMHEFPADGSSENWGWITPISWDITSGECWLIKPVKKKLCSYKSVPMSVITHSKACDFETQVIDCGKGDKPEDYENAKGKIALITGQPRNIFQLAAKCEVKGLIIHPSPERIANLGANTIQYDGFWPVEENLSKVTSGFSISHRQFLELNKHLENYKNVLVHFKIDAEFSKENGKLHVLETMIQGSGNSTEEVVFIAHLCHPSEGANDNSSGSATLVELVSVLNNMVMRGDVPQPERTLRFLWVPEFSGTVQWLKLYDQKKGNRKIIASLNLDMVGESPEKIGSPLTITCPSYSTPTYLRTLIAIIAKYISEEKPVYAVNRRLYQLNYRLKPFAGGSDHLLFNDQYFSVPSVMFGHEDPYHHSTADTLDKVDPLECKSVAIIAGSVGLCLSNVDKQFVEDLVSFVFLEGMNDIIHYQSNLKTTKLADYYKIKQIKLLQNHILQRMKSVCKLKPEVDFQNYISYYFQIIEKLFNQIQNQFTSPSEEIEQDKITKIYIKRNYEGLTPLKRIYKTDRSNEDKKRVTPLVMEHWGGIPLELLNLADGSLTVEEIFLLLKMQYENVSFKIVIALVKLFLKEETLVEA